ncbi:MAG: sensor histidine kinase [Firmicutes bacterium]|nr:sensor histidine kinase [Bacillota bacterium]
MCDVSCTPIRNDEMNTIQNKFLTYIILISVLPIAILGMIYYNFSINTVNDKILQVSREKLVQFDNSIIIKTNRMQDALDLLFTSKRMHDLLRNTNFSIPNEATSLAVKELDVLLAPLFSTEEKIENIILFSTAGGVYVYNGYIEDENIVRFATRYGRPDEESGKITWLGASANPTLLNGSDSVTMVGSVLKDMRDEKFLATVYVVLENDYFDSNGQTNNVTASTMVYDKNAKVIFSEGNLVLDNIWRESLKSGMRIFGGDRGNFRAEINGESYMIVFHTSPVTGWKYVQTMPYNEYFRESNRIGIITITILALILITAIFVNYFVVKKIVSPIRELVQAMDNVGNQNFEVNVSINSKDEFGMIGKGFNTMVEKIKELFARVISEERKRKEADILALQYQMNPHFLYNTLSSIRLVAMGKNQKDIAEMLFLLGRFLRNTIKNANRLVKVIEEIKNIQDYISLYQIRYENQLHIKYVIDKKVENCMIPSMLLQPIIENAIMHGLNNKFDSGERAELDVNVLDLPDEKICICIKDNGIGINSGKMAELFNERKKSDDSLHIGIINIHKRVGLLFGEEYGVSVLSEENSFTEVRITLPKIMD